MTTEEYLIAILLLSFMLWTATIIYLTIILTDVKNLIKERNK